MGHYRARLLRGVKRLGLLLGALIALTVLLALARTGVECQLLADYDPATAPPQSRHPATEGVEGYTRPEERSYLTFPEWYIVYSADEYGAFVAHEPPSAFPFFRSIAQYWKSYYEICEVTRDRYAFNGEFHLVLAVIGSSFTVEYMIKGLYEGTIGRVTEWLSAGGQTEEDAYAQAVAVEYGQFLHTVPWYQFPFGERLRGLWSETAFWGPYPLRKWERKLALTLEYGSKALYGWLIRQGMQATYAADELEIALWATGVPERLIARERELALIKRLDEESAIVTLPRYEPFTQIVPGLMQRGVRFVEVAGNDEILITVIAPNPWEGSLPGSERLFALALPTDPSRQRVALRVQVATLHLTLAALAEGPVTLEHLYDY